MEQSPSREANNHSARQEIPRILWIPIVHYHIHKSPPLFNNLSQMSPVHTFHCISLRSILILSSYPQVFRMVFFQILYAFLIYSIRATRPAHLILLDLITLIIAGEAQCHSKLLQNIGHQI
jgi:hypothetical protein